MDKVRDTRVDIYSCSCAFGKQKVERPVASGRLNNEVEIFQRVHVVQDGYAACGDVRMREVRFVTDGPFRHARYPVPLLLIVSIGIVDVLMRGRVYR